MNLVYSDALVCDHCGESKTTTFSFSLGNKGSKDGSDKVFTVCQSCREMLAKLLLPIVYMVLTEVDGIPGEPAIYSNEEDCDVEFGCECKENGLTIEEPANDDYCVRMFASTWKTDAEPH